MINKFILLILLFIPTAICAQQSLFDYLEGDVRIKRSSGEMFEASLGDYIYIGDSVITGYDGYAELTLGNSSKISIDKETVFRYSQKEQQKEKRNIFLVVLGKIGFKFDKLLQEPEIRTPATIAGIRGTEFTVITALDGTSLFIVDEGAVSVESEGTMVVLEQLEGVEVPIGETPGEKFDVLVGQIDYDSWLDENNENFYKDPINTIKDMTLKLEDFVNEADSFFMLYERNSEDLSSKREELKDKTEDREDFYKSEVFPRELETGNNILNYRFFALSSLSLRRHVISEMYVHMKTKYLLDLENPLYQSFLSEYEKFLRIYEQSVVKYLVESDI